MRTPHMEPTRPSGSVFVVGGINCDITGAVTAAVQPGTSNPGRVTLSAGGVARNVAENLARLGTEVVLFGAVGTDPLSRWVLERTRESGVDTGGVIRRRTHLPGMYVSVLGAGELESAVADMTATETLRPADVVRRLDAAAVSAPPGMVILDTNLVTGTLQAAMDWAARRQIPVLVDPVSVEKAGRLARCRGVVEFVTPNADEAELLRGWRAGGSSLRVRYWIETDGVAGVTLREGAGPRETVRRFPVTSVMPVNVNGAGDAFVAAFAAALIRGLEPEEAIRRGIAAGALTVASEQTVDPHMSWQRIEAAVEKEK